MAAKPGKEVETLSQFSTTISSAARKAAMEKAMAILWSPRDCTFPPLNTFFFVAGASYHNAVFALLAFHPQSEQALQPLRRCGRFLYCVRSPGKSRFANSGGGGD